MHFLMKRILLACSCFNQADCITTPVEPSVVWLVKSDSYLSHRNQDGTWTDVPGLLDQIEVGEFGTFGVNLNNQIYYQRGTHEDPYAAGTGWQLLPVNNIWKYISSGRDTAYVIDVQDNLYEFQNVSIDDNGDMLLDLVPLDGRLSQVSVHRNVAWGVDADNGIWMSYNIPYNTGTWETIDNEPEITQIEVGQFGVFGTNANNEIYYRVGTHENDDDIRLLAYGADWQLIPKPGSGLTQITSGLNNAYGIDFIGTVYQMKPNAFNEETGEFDEEGLWEIMVDADHRKGSFISAL